MAGAGHRPPIRPDRVRRIDGGFAFVPSRFLHDGFFASLGDLERSLYFFLVIAGDRNGISFYGHERICAILEITLDDYIAARNGLIHRDLIAFDGIRFQVLSLPPAPTFITPSPLVTNDEFDEHDPATVKRIIESSLARRH
jgi:hypothetical protein